MFFACSLSEDGRGGVVERKVFVVAFIASPLVVGKAPLVGTSAPVVPLQKEDPSAAPVVTLVPLSAADATSTRADLIILSSDSEDEVDWEALATEDEVDWGALAIEDDDDVEYVGSGSPARN